MIGMNLCDDPLWSAHFKCELSQVIVMTLRSKCEGASSGHSAYGIVVSILQLSVVPCAEELPEGLLNVVDCDESDNRRLFIFSANGTP